MVQITNVQNPLKDVIKKFKKKCNLTFYSFDLETSFSFSLFLFVDDLT